MERYTTKKIIKNTVFGFSAIALACSTAIAVAGNAQGDNNNDQGGKKSPGVNYVLQGACAHLPADRMTEFHGNPEKAVLRLGMAGNQWVVFDKVMQGFNESQGITTPPNTPEHLPNGSYTLADLNEAARSYYIQLIPPGQIRDQIKSGCMILGNEDDRNFLPGSIQVDFDVYTSTNYNLMRNLAGAGFLTEALPYIKNKLDLMVDLTNSKDIGTAGAPGTYANIYDIVTDLLTDCTDADADGVCEDEGIRVSEVDHVNEGIHNAINAMYKAMDEYIRENGSDADKQALTAALNAVGTGKPGSPSLTRPGTVAKYDHSQNSDCHYAANLASVAGGTLDRVDLNSDGIADDVNGDGLADAGDVGTFRFCEFSILNKTNTHETRVHHVETPGGILAGDVDVGPVWTSELKYAQAAGDEVSGMDQVGGSGGVASPGGDNPVVNAPATYSIAVLATTRNPGLAQAFVDYVRSAAGQEKYTTGGFIGLTPAELAGGEVYDCDGDGIADVLSGANAVPQTCP